MAALLAASAVVAGTTPAEAWAQGMRMDEGPRARPEGGPPRGGPGGPAGRLERSEGRPLFHERESFPENRPAFRPDHAEAPRPPAPAPRVDNAPPRPRDGGDRGSWRNRPDPAPMGQSRDWNDRTGWRNNRPEPSPAPGQPGPDRVGPGGVRVERPNWGQDRRQQWQDRARDDQRWRDDDRRRREDRDRWRRSYGDWRDQNDQAYGFAERRAWADQWNRSWRRDRRYDWMGWRSLNRGAYHLPRYYAPYGGYGYQRFSSGVILEPMFFGQNYWLDDPYAYRLPPAYGPYRWVRYFNDAILVDLRSGLVVDVVYDIFW